MVRGANRATKVERELFPVHTAYADQSPLCGQANLAISVCASMLRAGGMVEVEEAAERAGAAAAVGRNAGMVPATDIGQRARSRVMTAAQPEGEKSERSTLQDCKIAQHLAFEHGRRRQETGGDETTHESACGHVGKELNTASNCACRAPAARADAEPLLTMGAALGTSGLKRTLEAAGIEDAAKQAMHLPREHALASVRHQRAAYAGWALSEVAAARSFGDAAAIATAAGATAEAVIASIPEVCNKGKPELLVARVAALMLAFNRVQASLIAGTQAHMASGYAAAAAARDAGVEAEHAVGEAMDEAGRILVQTVTQTAALVCGFSGAADTAKMAVEEPEWLREAAEEVGVGGSAAVRVAAAPATASAVTPPTAGRRAAASVRLQSAWRAVCARHELRARREAAGAAADAAREERKRAARERLALREAEERAKRETGANARREAKARCAQQRVATIVPVAPAPRDAARRPYIVPAAPGRTRLHSLARRTEAAQVVQAAWRRCLRRRAVRNAHWALLVAEADADLARRCAAQEEERAAAMATVQQRVATVRAFRQLEADLRAQGVRVASGSASGGRQRARLREQRRWERWEGEQRRREGIAERIWQGTMR